MELLHGTRLGSILQTFFYLSGFSLYGDHTLPHSSNSGESSDRFLFDSAEHSHLSLLDVFHKVASVSSSALDINVTRCYGVLGCIRLRHTEERGFSLFPRHLHEIKPTICLQLANHRQCQLVTNLSPDPAVQLKRLLLASGKNSYWIAHGYFENGQRKWIQEMATELLAADPTSNVFIVDWPKGVEPPYNQAAMNTELVGNYVGFVMAMLENIRGLKVDLVHGIGHSLGAHMFGFAGTWLKERGFFLGRITGMDPAQPYFELLPEDVRLDSSDATFVDVIHTDALPLMHGGPVTGLGTQEPSGHIDFYPNAGSSQPGCDNELKDAIAEEKGSFRFGILRFFGCNHIRAFEYFTESIRSNCSFAAFRCPSFDSLMDASCEEVLHGCEIGGSDCNRMGFHAKLPGDGVYLEYCRREN